MVYTNKFRRVSIWQDKETWHIFPWKQGDFSRKNLSTNICSWKLGLKNWHGSFSTRHLSRKIEKDLTKMFPSQAKCCPKNLGTRLNVACFTDASWIFSYGSQTVGYFQNFSTHPEKLQAMSDLLSDCFRKLFSVRVNISFVLEYLWTLK